MDHELIRHVALRGNVPGRMVIARQDEFPFAITVDDSVPDGEIWFRHADGTIDKIVNIRIDEEAVKDSLTTDRDSSEDA